MKSQSNNTTSMKNDNKLAELFHEELKDIYGAEQMLIKSLPEMQEAAASDELKNAFADHLEKTKEHVSRLEKVFELTGHETESKKCEAMDGLLKEGRHLIDDTEDGTATRDAALILAAQKVEHYEIATYGSLAQLAKTLGYDEAKQLLGTTLEEEKQADETLTVIAEQQVNCEAMEE